MTEEEGLDLDAVFTFERFEEQRLLLLDSWFQPEAKIPQEASDAFAELANWPSQQWPRPNPGDKPHTVAIIGKAYERLMVPWGKGGWEYWGLNDHAGERPPIEAYTRWFQLHPPSYLGRHSRRSLDSLQEAWTRDRGLRMYMDRHYKKYPNSERYPKRDVEALVSHGRYHTSSFDWMLALAILEGFKDIWLVACEFYTPPPYNGEPLSGRPCLEFWSGVAEGRGAKVRSFSWGSDLFRTVHLARLQTDIQYGFGREPGLELGNGWRDLR